MNKKEIKTLKSKEKIIRCAIEMLGDHGYDNFTVSALCKNYDISKGLFYHNFSGKAELFLSCVKVCYQTMLDFFRSDSEIPTLEQYIALRLRFFRENPRLSRIFFESYIQTETAVFEEVKKIRSGLIAFNRSVYSRFLDTVTLRQGISREDAMEHFEMLQKMFNSYYSSPIFRKEDVEFLEMEHRLNFAKFLDCIIYGVVEKSRG